MPSTSGVQVDVLFVGLTRPPMVFGVTYPAMLLNVVMTMEAFIVTKNLLWLLTFVPVHGLFVLVCMYEPRFFDLAQLWGRTAGIGLAFGNARHWKANSYSPLSHDLPNAKGRRRRAPTVIV